MKIQSFPLFAAALSSLFLLGGCANDLTAHADSLAQPAGLHREQVKTDTFLLTAYSKVTDPELPFDVYIEGDGFAWRTEMAPSINPTPRVALGLALAARDPAPNVIYIARPCQFTPLDLDPHCNVSYWTGKRFSEEVIASVNQAIDKMTAQYGGPDLNLIGYSGGGAVAVLVAARRVDVVSLRTVAGNLDHKEVNRQHDVSQMDDSLNAIDQARDVAMIPQLHFSGSKDAIISPDIAKRFLKASQPTNCVHVKNISDVSHEDGWVELWPSLLKKSFACRS